MSRKCQTEVCFLCHSKFFGRRHRHTEGWPPSIVAFVEDESGLNVGNRNVCVCEACRQSIMHSMKAKENSEPYQLRWLKNKTVSVCCVPSCSSTDIKAEKHEFTWEVICDSMGIARIESPRDVSLCTKHYQQIYRMLNAKSRACKSCGVLTRNSKHNFISCPDPKRVESFLRDTIAFSENIQCGDQVCYPCYKFFNQMLKSDVCMLSSEDIVSKLKAKKENLEGVVHEFEYLTPDPSDIVECCLYKTALHACELVASDHPFLFPSMYRQFIEHLGGYDIDFSGVCTSKSRLLTFLGNEFGELLTSFCVDRSIGTVFHRTKADMHSLLSHTLHANSSCTAASQDYHTNLLNYQVHELVNHQKSELRDQSMKLAFDVDKFVDMVRSVAPDLWDHVCIITQSINERKGRSTSVKDSTFAGRIKHLRQAYLVSLIVFITNSECNSPFHAVLSDIIESCGGSTELITTLNRFGICSSVDTLNRIIHSVSLDRKNSGTRSLLAEKAFTVASTDNVDFLQSSAAVYSGDQRRSWHATSIQLVQPMPNTAVHSEQSAATRRLFSTAGEATTSGSTESSSNQHACVSVMPTLVETGPAEKLRLLLSRKRQERSSPIASPLKSTRSPHTKRARTFAEAVKHHSRDVLDMEVDSIRQPMASNASSAADTVQLESFQVTASEQRAVDNLNENLFSYVLMKEASSPDKLLVDLKTFCGMTLPNIPKVQCSNVVYLPVVDLHADSTEAMQAVVAKLHKEYGIGESADYLVLVGDQKTYTRICELKQEYGTELDWVIPFIGDWHLLSNYQSVLMKVYYDAGLKDLAEYSGHRGETLTSIKKCSSFKRTHQFLLQAWEAMYRQMFKAFECVRDNDDDSENSISDIVSAAKANMLECDKKMSESDSCDPLKEYLERTREVHSKVHGQFTGWVSALKEKDPNWKFWADFVFRDMLSYLCLFLSMRSGMWKLRLSGIKSMAPLFVAFDRPHYQKLIPNHLRDLTKMPSDVMKFFESGAFVCSITGRHMRSVALDEAHEMLVNKDLKTTIVRPSKEYLDRMLYYYPVRSMVLNAVKNAVLLDLHDMKSDKFSVFDTSQQSVKREENVKCMMTKVQSSNTLDVLDEVRPLTSMSGQVATPEQKVDLLGFWEVGHERFENQVKFYVLKDPSAVVPKRKVKLLTFASSRKLKKKMKQLDKEKKLVGKCLRKAFAWNVKFGSNSQHVGQQYIELPRAISDPNGNLHKGQKSYTTKWLEKRYKNLICNQLPGGWVPDVVVLEGMFMINTSPLTTHSTMKDYAQFLLRRFVLHHLTNGCSEVHVVFDNPGRQPNSPKSFERKRRDDTASLSSDHKHVAFSDACSVPSNWRDCLACRECKRALVLYLGLSFKQFATGTCRLREHQKIILAGCFSGVEEDQAWEISTGGAQPVPTLSCEAEEADTRVWLHVLRSPGTRKLVCSPDTDVYHIGLPLISNQPMEVFVRVSMFSSQEHRYLSLNNLLTSLQGDPDLSSIQRELLPKVLQTLFICTGCDYVSYFAGIGKSTFLKIFFQHATFINSVFQGTPGNTLDTSCELGFLSFVRLVGTVYFKKHLPSFKHDCPRALLNSLSSSDPISQHKQWLECIRSTVWENIEFEDELPPSWEALRLHWLRSCWVSHFWQQACNNTYHLLDVNEFGWKVVEGCLEIDWDDPSNFEQVKESVRLLLRGCGCKKGCSNKRCSCFKAGVKCGPGCRCTNCENVPSSRSPTSETDDNEVEQAELQDDHSLRQTYNSEIVDSADTTSDHEQDEEELSEEDD